MNFESDIGPAVTATLNFAANRADGGQFSNTNPSVSRQDLVPVNVEINNIRTLRRAPMLAEEGFEIARHDVGRADWSNQEWIDTVYVPSCVDLIKTLTGAHAVIPLYFPMVRRSDYADHDGAAPTARFVHLDMPRDACRNEATTHAETHGITFERATIYNVWKAITPPPHDVPLAVCDRRTLSEEDFVIGMTVEGEIAVPHVTIAHSSKEPKWYYVPDLGPDETLVFVGGDMNPGHPLGCAHSAFVHPVQSSGGMTRASIETRVLACFA